MLKKLVYTLLKQVAKLNVYLYFNKIEINGKENIPPEGTPIIFAPNHQGAFLDAVIVGVLSPNPVNYLTRSDVFKPATNWFLSALKMIPIYRIRDGFASLSKNEAIFETCKQLLIDQNQILIFPEGNHNDTYYLRPITKGISRIALNSQLANDQDIFIVPVGINYFSHTDSGHKLILNYGTPINAKKFIPKDQTLGPRILNDFRKEVNNAMKAQLVIPEKSDNYNNQVLIFNKDNAKLKFEEIRALAATDQTFVESKKSQIPHFIAELLKLPNLPLFLFYRFVEENKIGQRAFISSIKLAFGMFVFPFWILISFLFVGLIFSWKWAGYIIGIQILSILIRRIFRASI